MKRSRENNQVDSQDIEQPPTKRLRIGDTIQLSTNTFDFLNFHLKSEDMYDDYMNSAEMFFNHTEVGKTVNTLQKVKDILFANAEKNHVVKKMKKYGTHELYRSYFRAAVQVQLEKMFISAGFRMVLGMAVNERLFDYCNIYFVIHPEEKEENGDF